jgi:amidase
MKNFACMFAVAVFMITSRVEAQSFAIEETTIAGVQEALQGKATTCRQIVQAYLDRIAAYDRKGPALNAILTLNPKALAEADRLDAERAAGAAMGPLFCAPLVLKDNYNTADLPTTGGSAALEGMQPPADAFVVARLRKAGAIILGKSNMHEFALAGTTVSSLGGQTLDAYDLTRTPGGSSGGTGVAVAANLALAGTGSDTVNSIRSPASANALVGIRPTKGLLSRSGIMPVSETQDAIGPIARNVADAARLLEVMAGYDPNDPATAWSIGNTPAGYVQFLKAGGLRGARIGVLKAMYGNASEHQDVNAVMAAAIAALKNAGAEVVDVDAPALDANKLGPENDVQKYEFKTLINAYLAQCPGKDTFRDHRIRQGSQAFAGEIFVERGSVHQRHGGAGLQGAAVAKPAYAAGADVGFRRARAGCDRLPAAATAGRAVERTQSGRPQRHSCFRHRISGHHRAGRVLAADRKCPAGRAGRNGYSGKTLERGTFD